MHALTKISCSVYIQCVIISPPFSESCPDVSSFTDAQVQALAKGILTVGYECSL
jgi:hypothetical protein